MNSDSLLFPFTITGNPLVALNYNFTSFKNAQSRYRNENVNFQPVNAAKNYLERRERATQEAFKAIYDELVKNRWSKSKTASQNHRRLTKIAQSIMEVNNQMRIKGLEATIKGDKFKVQKLSSSVLDRPEAGILTTVPNLISRPHPTERNDDGSAKTEILHFNEVIEQDESCSICNSTTNHIHELSENIHQLTKTQPDRWTFFSLSDLAASESST